MGNTMIITIDALNKHMFKPLLDDMFQLRARVFGDRLGWEVNIENGMEIDQFDHMDPGYVVGVDDEMNVISCARVLQTTGPHMLADVFSAILDGEPPLRSPNIWESTRFCVDTARLKRDDCKHTVSTATCEMMVGILEYAKQSGVTDIITVIDPIMDRVLKRSDNAPHGYVGKKVQMGKVPALAALLDCTNERIQRVRAFAGVTHDVMMPEEEAVEKMNLAQTKKIIAQEMAEASKEAPVKTPEISDLQRYCYEQVLNATETGDMSAALELLQLLSDKVGASTPGELQRIAHDLPSRNVMTPAAMKSVMRAIQNGAV